MRGHEKEETNMKTEAEVILEKMLAEDSSIVRVGKGASVELTNVVKSLLDELEELRLDNSRLEEENRSLRNTQALLVDGAEEHIRRAKQELSEASSAALNSMNYLFLRKVFKDDDIGESAVNELESFFQMLFEDEKSLSDEGMRKVFLSEIGDGEYFEGKTETEVRDSILEATKEWMVEPEKVANFYVSLMKEEETD